MRITFLVFNIDGLGGTSRSVITQANTLAQGVAGDHQTRILSFTRSAAEPHHSLDPRVQVEYLVDLSDPGSPSTVQEGLVAPATATALAEAQSRYMPRSWDRHFNRLIDVAAEHRLPTLESDVVVTTTPELLGVAVQLLDKRVAVVHQEHRSTPSRGADMPPPSPSRTPSGWPSSSGRCAPSWSPCRIRSRASSPPGRGWTTR